MIGFKVIGYHGTNVPDIKTFRLDGKESNGAIFFSKTREYADEAAYVKKEFHGGTETVYAAKLLIQYPYIACLKPGKFADPVAEKSIIQYAKAEGFDGVIFYEDREEDSDVFFAVFSPEQIEVQEIYEAMKE